MLLGKVPVMSLLFKYKDCKCDKCEKKSSGMLETNPTFSRFRKVIWESSLKTDGNGITNEFLSSDGAS